MVKLIEYFKTCPVGYSTLAYFVSNAFNCMHVVTMTDFLSHGGIIILIDEFGPIFLQFYTLLEVILMLSQI